MERAVHSGRAAVRLRTTGPIDGVDALPVTELVHRDGAARGSSRTETLDRPAHRDRLTVVRLRV